MRHLGMPFYGRVLGRRLGLFAVGGAAPSPMTLILDEFTGTNGTALGSHVIAPTNTSATSWSALVGTWQILSNKAKVSASDGDGQCTAVCVPGIADCTVTCDVTFNSSGIDAGIIANAADATNYWLMRVASANNTVKLYQRVMGTFTEHASMSYTPTPGATVEFKLITNGDTITGYLAGSQVVSYNTAGRALKTNTKAGIRVFGITDTGSNFDNFKVTNATS